MNDEIRKWASFAMVAVILLLSIVRTSDRFTAADALKTVQSRDADRGALWRELCKHHPDCDRTPEPINGPS